MVEDVIQSTSGICETEDVQNKKPELVGETELDNSNKANNSEVKDDDNSPAQSPPKMSLPNVVVSISSADRLSAELGIKAEPSPGRTAAKITIAEADQTSRRSSVRCSLKLRHSLAGLRHSMTQDSVRRASRRSMLKRKAARMGNSTCSSNVDGEKLDVLLDIILTL